jgi:lipoprotein-anchoring transpeptidase ErfK/SrfK
MRKNSAKSVKLGSQLTLIGILFLTICSCACEPANAPNNNRQNQSSQSSELPAPTIEANPISKKDDQWQVISSDKVTLTVTAPGATSVKILYRPAFTEGRHIELKNLTSPSEPATGKFSTDLKVPSDFAGDVWAEASYSKGAKKETSPISLTVEAISPDELAGASYKHTEESARSDKFTGGHIEKANFQPGQGDIRITVNIPAFQLTLWQNGKEVKTYEIGIGRKDFKLPSGLRYAKQIVFNPDWVPPNSSWVFEHDVSPGEVVEADDPRNPLGKVKIPLGNGILIHQAFKPSDIGHLVSHGCVRLRLDELYDLIDKIVAARSLPVSRQQLDQAKKSKDRFVIKLDAPLVVDINYDTQVVEGGVLHLYPDVYNQKTNGVDDLRAELREAGVDSASVDDNVLRQMLNRVSMTQEFIVNVADLKAGKALIAGRNEPLPGQPKAQPSKPQSGASRGGKKKT